MCERSEAKISNNTHDIVDYHTTNNNKNTRIVVPATTTTRKHLEKVTSGSDVSLSRTVACSCTLKVNKRQLTNQKRKEATVHGNHKSDPLSLSNVSLGLHWIAVIQNTVKLHGSVKLYPRSVFLCEWSIIGSERAGFIPFLRVVQEQFVPQRNRPTSNTFHCTVRPR